MKKATYVLTAAICSGLLCTGCGSSKPIGSAPQNTVSIAVETQEIAAQSIEGMSTYHPKYQQSRKFP